MQTSPLLLFCNVIFNFFCNFFFYNVCKRIISHFSYFLLASRGAPGILGGNHSPPTLTQFLEKGEKGPLNMQYLLQGVDVFFFSEITTDIFLEIG